MYVCVCVCVWAVVRAGFTLSASTVDRSAHLSDATMHQSPDDAQQYPATHAGRRRETAACRRPRQARGVAE